MDKPTVEILPRIHGGEPYVQLHFGPMVTEEQADRVREECTGFGLSAGYGPGRYIHAVNAAKIFARRLRRIGWSVFIETA